jgi:DNA ligase (NAD+)
MLTAPDPQQTESADSLAARAAHLAERIRYHQHRYYMLDDPEIRPGVRRALRRLRTLEAAHPELRTTTAPPSAWAA